MDSSGDWLGRWCFLPAASYFLLFSFSLPFCLFPLLLHRSSTSCSPFRVSLLQCGSPMGCNTSDNVFFHGPPPPVSAYVSPSHSSSHLLLCLLRFPLSSPHMIPEKVGTALTGHFPIKIPSRIMLEWPEGLPSSYPSSWSVCTELSTSVVVTPGLCISTKCRVRKSKTRVTYFTGSDHQAQLIRSLPHHLPTQVLQPLELFHAETVEEIFSQTGWCSVFLPCLSPSPPFHPEIQASIEIVDGHIPQHSFPELESASTNWSSFNSTVNERLHILLSAIQMHPQTLTASETHLFLII